MFVGKKFKRFFAAVFGGVYLFVALFSQNFHEHGSAEVSSDFTFKKSEKTYTSTSLTEAFSDCLSCHIFHTGNSLIPQEFHFSIIKNEDFQKQIFAFQQRFVKCEFFYLQLRGPPVNFV